MIETEYSRTHRVEKPLDHTEVTQLKRTLSKDAADKIDKANEEMKVGHGHGTESSVQHAMNPESKM